MSNCMKLVACLTMLIDHLGRILFDNNIIFNMIGRLSMPLFAYMIAMSISKTRDIKKYLILLGVTAVVSQVPYLLVIGFYLNIIFGFLIAVIGIWSMGKAASKFEKAFILMASLILAEICKIEYGFYAVSLVFIFYYMRDAIYYVPFMFIVTGIFTLQHNVPVQLLSMLSLLLIFLYNVKIKVNKYVFYGFYPVHLMMLYIARAFI